MSDKDAQFNQHWHFKQFICC